MSQTPPPMQPPGIPPLGYPSQETPFYGRPRTSGAAIASLVFGILGCLQITAIVAIISGIVGIVATKNPMVKGRGMAITGLVLGCVFLLGGVVLLGGAGMIWSASKPQRTVANRFIDELAQSKAVAAQADCDGNISPTQIDSLISTVQNWTPLAGHYVMAVVASNQNSVTTGLATGFLVSHDGMKHIFEMGLVQDSGAWKVHSIKFADQSGSATQPAP